MWKIVAAALLAGSAIYAGVQWVWFYETLAQAPALIEPGVVEGLGLERPAVTRVTRSRLRELADPGTAIRRYGAGRLLLLLGLAVVVIFVWARADLRSEGPRGRLLLAGLIALPGIAGFGSMAGLEARASVRNLYEAGLTNPSLLGAAVAGLYGMVLVGAALALGLAGVFLGLLRRTGRS